jgi:hypothetical protein
LNEGKLSAETVGEVQDTLLDRAAEIRAPFYRRAKSAA